MNRITAVFAALVLTVTSSAALAVDCLSYLAADTALKKDNNDAHAAYRKAVRAAETDWEEAIQNREVAWREAGKAAYEVFSKTEAGYRNGLEALARDLRQAKADADAIRELAGLGPWWARKDCRIQGERPSRPGSARHRLTFSGDLASSRSRIPLLHGANRIRVETPKSVESEGDNIG